MVSDDLLDNLPGDTVTTIGPSPGDEEANEAHQSPLRLDAACLAACATSAATRLPLSTSASRSSLCWIRSSMWPSLDFIPSRYRTANAPESAVATAVMRMSPCGEKQSPKCPPFRLHGYSPTGVSVTVISSASTILPWLSR